MNIDIRKLVDEIHAAEAAHRSGKWAEFCEQRGLGRFTSYAKTVTGLYTLRAWHRGKCHRLNPPESIRDFNRTMIEQGRSERLGWDRLEHNKKIAEKIAPHFQREVILDAAGSL